MVGNKKKVLVDELTCIRGKDQLSSDKKLTIKFVTFHNHIVRMLKIQI